jgi:hypothetical protein
MPASSHNRKTLDTGFPLLWARIRYILGWCCIGLGLLGSILPVIPGIPFFILGVALVGRRDQTLRRCVVLLKLNLRRSACIR